jgi:putative phosphoribosyl transferase
MKGGTMPFQDRADAGRQLATRLMRYKNERPVVLGLPRGGVPVAYEIARALDAPLDVIVVRKLGAPHQPELGIGAVVDGDHPQRVLNEEVMQSLYVSRQYLETEVARQLEEIHRRQTLLRAGRSRVYLADRTVIVVDDGVATGGTVRAAVRGVRRANPRRIVLAVGVAPPETIEVLRTEVDDLVCIVTPADFGAVGQFYRDFRQISDDEVIALLGRAADRVARANDRAPVRA